MIKFGVHLFLWADRFDVSALPLIKKVKQMGFDGVEIPLNYIDSINIEQTKKELKKNDMEFTASPVLGLDKDVTSSDETVRKKGISYLKRCVEVVSELGGDSMNGVIYTAWGKITGKSRTEDEWRYSVESLREVCRYAQEFNVALGLEPVNRFETYFLNTASDAVKLAKEVREPNVKVHLDTFHMNIEEKDFYNPIIQAGKLLNHFHCCENDRSIAGTGHVDWDKVFEALAEISYDKWLVLESFTQDMEKLAASTAIWRKLAPSADALASEGLAFIKKMSKQYL